MTSLNIDSFQNNELKKAMQAADSQGENASNNILDQNELSVFIKNAYQNNIPTEEIMKIVEQFEISQTEEDKTQKTIATLKELESLKKELESDYIKKEKKHKKIASLAAIVGIVGSYFTSSKIDKYIPCHYDWEPLKVTSKPWLITTLTLLGIGVIGLLEAFKNSELRVKYEIENLENQLLKP